VKNFNQEEHDLDTAIEDRIRASEWSVPEVRIQRPIKEGGDWIYTARLYRAPGQWRTVTARGKSHLAAKKAYLQQLLKTE